MSGKDVYECPVCAKPFHRDDKLSDFALAAHEKEHRTMKPERLLVSGESGWRCTLCGELLRTSEDMARIAMISHMKVHGIRPASSAPDATGGGKGRLDAKGLIERAAGRIGVMVGKILDS